MAAGDGKTVRPSNLDDAYRFVEALVQALQSYGVSSRSMVETLSRVVKALGIHAQFVATPNFVQTVLWGEDEHEQRVHLAVLRSGDYDLGKLVRVMKLADQVEAGEMTPADALASLQEIEKRPSSYSPPVLALAFVVCGLGYGVFIGTRFIDAVLGGVVALASFGVTRLAARSPSVDMLREFLAAAIAASLAYLVAAVVPGTDPNSVIVCAIIVFVPGFGLTVAPNELIVGNTVSGIIWLTNASVTALKLVGGMTLGAALVLSLPIAIEPVSPSGHIPAFWRWLAVPAVVVTLAILFRVERRHFWAIALGGWLIFGVMQVGNLFGFWQGTFLGATVLMMYARWFGHRSRLVSTVVVLPCIMLLVPGLAALEALHTVNTEGIVAGFRAGYGVVVLIMAIVGGGMVGEALALRNLVKTGKAVTSLIERPPIPGRKGKGRGRQ